MTWTGKDICVRIIDKNDARIRDVISSRIPGVRFVEHSDSAGGLNILLSFRPPEDEPLSAYDWVHSAGAGVDHLCKAIADPDAAPVITRTTGRMGQQIGEYCLAYGLAHLQKMSARQALASDCNWDKAAASPRYGFDTQVSIFGTGSIGSGIARAFKAIGAAVIGYSKSGSPARHFDAVRPLSEFSEHLPPDILVLALPETPETSGLVDETVLTCLQGALLINVGRGATLQPEALRDAFASGRIAHAVLDVFETEPLPPDDWRWRHPQVTVTPHVSGLTLPDDAANALCDLLENYLQTGERPQSVDVRRGY